MEEQPEFKEEVDLLTAHEDDASRPTTAAGPIGMFGFEPSNEPFDPKRERIRMVKVADQPSSYQTNAHKEQLVLEYVENFRRQFAELYPRRREMILTPYNECGIPKFICTTIRPTQLEFMHLYDAENCARWVADYLSYDALEKPLEYPTHVVSPTFTLEHGAGDCFDYAVTLASLLIGVGFDAYCVVGYAAHEVTSADLSKVECPSTMKKEEVVEKEAKEVKEPAYKIKQRPDLSSKFLAAQAEKKRLASLPKQEVEEEEDEGEEDELDGQRVHCWVLVLAGKREVPDNFFIEPSTGHIRSADDARYQGIEAMFNHNNYWINMQETDEPGCKFLSFDLGNTSKWEYIFLDNVPPLLGADKEKEEEEEDDGGVLEEEDENKGDSDDDEDLLNEGEINQPVLDLPESWVGKVVLTEEEYENCPKLAKITYYSKCKQENFAEYARDDGMTLRLVLFSDKQNKNELEVRETFKHRKDKLDRRMRYPLERRVDEFFDHGRSHGLKELKQIKGEYRQMLFYPDARPDDGLYRREEFTGKKFKQWFQDRDDRLIYRGVSFQKSPVTGASSAYNISTHDNEDLNIRKITEKFARDEDVDADSDVQKRVFDVTNGNIKVIYHYGNGRITAASRTYWKNLDTNIVQIDPFAKYPKKSEQFEELHRLMQVEKECIQAIREDQRETREILQTRDKEEAAVDLTISVYDTMRRHKDVREEEKEAELADTQRDHDYLAPFLTTRGIKLNTKILQPEDAKVVKDDLLRALKERLIERANIIQERLEEENQALFRRQQAFQRNRDHADRAEEEEYEKFCNDTMFRIQILERRLQRHEEQSLKKYADTDLKLREDPRFSLLFQNQSSKR